ncbi:hypothetical protein [Marinobacter sp. CHS3-4]|uniref:hypothetical protein n=1 Tax=Marinobacter sp. CHS3-4 TaxID=3045174 RepID=UPI0024B56F82|nr:hypothetical protein [Marinobacter sp. CHS3-4]MDI9244274.1 hypothetical protein [Marinobacter sp. CHS3-4]
MTEDQWVSVRGSVIRESQRSSILQCQLLVIDCYGCADRNALRGSPCFLATISSAGIGV